MIGVPLLLLGLLLVLGAFGPEDAERERGIVTRFIRAPLHPATWLATGAIVAGFWVELFAFLALIAILSTGVSLLFVGIGVVLIVFAIEGSRIVARIERRRAMVADPRPLIPHAYRPYGSGLRELLTALFLDVNRWRDVGYVFIAFPLTVLEFSAVVALWGATLFLLSVPVWTLLTGEVLGGLDVAAGPLLPALSRLSTLNAPAVAIVSLVAGIVLLPVSSFAAQGLMALHRQVIAGLLCDLGTAALEQRVETLEVSRKAVLDVEASELRRIERDLHDGAQQRLVMLTINLGLAADKMDTDPDGGEGPRRRRPGPGAARPGRDPQPGARHRAVHPHGPRPRAGPVGARRAVAGADGRARVAARGRTRVRRRGAGGLLRRRGGAGERRQALAGDARRGARPPRGTAARRRGPGRRPRRGVAPARGRAHGPGGPGRGARRPARGHVTRGGPTMVRAEIPAAAQGPR